MINDKLVLLSLWEKVLKTRLIEEKICSLYFEKEIRCPVHLSIGQEGIAAGVCQALSKDDFVFSNHRSHAHYICKGGDINLMLAEIYGKKTGCCGGKGGSMHLIDKDNGFLGSTPIVAGTIPVAAGVALSLKLRDKTESIVVVFLGDAAVEEGVFHETLNFCSLMDLPIIFICENNQYSVYTHINYRQPKREISNLSKAHNIKSIRGDGNNPLEVFEIIKRLVEYVKKSGHPALAEFSTYRWREHCGVNYDNDLGYRVEDSFLNLEEKDPLKNLKRELEKSGISKLEIESKTRKIEKELEVAVNFAKESPFPEKDELNTNLFSEI